MRGLSSVQTALPFSLECAQAGIVHVLEGQLAHQRELLDLLRPIEPSPALAPPPLPALPEPTAEIVRLVRNFEDRLGRHTARYLNLARQIADEPTAVLIARRASDPERHRAAERFARWVWRGRAYSRNPRVAAELRRLTSEEIEALRQSAVLIAAREADERFDRLRIGRQWVTTIEGTLARGISPAEDFALETFDLWLAQRARHHLERAIDPRSGDGLIAALDAPAATRLLRDEETPEAKLLMQEESDRRPPIVLDPKTWRRLLSRQELKFLRAYLECIADLPDRTARSEARRRLKLSPENARHIFFRIRKKLKALPTIL